MSEIIEKNAANSNEIESIVPPSRVEELKSDSASCSETKAADSIGGSKMPESLETASIDKPTHHSSTMDISETPQTETTISIPEPPVQIKPNESKAIETVSTDLPISDAQKPPTTNEPTTNDKPVIGNDSMCNETTAKSIADDANVESKQSNTVENGIVSGEVKQQKPQIAGSIGSLGLLNQYVSSSDEDDSSSSSSSSGDSSSDDADTESESDDSTDASNNEVLGMPAIKDKELNTLANNILNTALSRDNYREASSDTSETDSDDSDVEFIGRAPAQTIDITNDDEIREFLDTCEENVAPGPIKAKGEFSIADLPPIEELTITVPESECVVLGKVSSIVDTLVLVESLPDFAAVDVDTVLFLDKGNRTLGQVFDVMGNVASPIYCVRFNTVQDIQSKDIKTGETVYVAPQSEYTNFIILSDLMRQKGCDASWENDHEAPEGCYEFSDDEEERLSRRRQNQRQHNRNRPNESAEQVPNKVTVKTEPNATHPNPNPNRMRRKYNQRGPKINKPPSRFYKDNRGYALTHPDSSNPYQRQQQFHNSRYQQYHRMQPMHQNYSWHTAAMHSNMPSTSTGSAPHRPQIPPPQPYTTNGDGGSNVYPNPFAMQANPMNYGPFNLQAFPPLPPPMSSMPPPPFSSQQNQPPSSKPFSRNNSNTFDQQ